MALENRRSLGTESGRLRRAARQVERDGGDPTRILTAAAEAKLGEGSAISRAEDNSARQEYGRRLQRGQNIIAARSLLGQGRGETAATQTPPVTGAAKPGALTPPSVGGPATAARQPAVDEPVGRINGEPASQVLSRPLDIKPSFGADVARKNLEEKGLDGAVADYQRRVAGTPAYKPGVPQEPGNMAELNARGTKSPLQLSIEAAAARRKQTEDLDANPALQAMENARVPKPPGSPGTPEFTRELQRRPGAEVAPETAPPVVADKPSSLGDAIGRDAAAVGRGASRTLRSAGEAFGDGSRALARRMRSAGEGAVDTTADTATLPLTTAASVVPGDTGEYLREKVREGNRSLRRTGRSILSASRPKTLLP